MERVSLFLSFIFSLTPSLSLFALVQKQTLPFDLAAPVAESSAILSLQTKKENKTKEQENNQLLLSAPAASVLWGEKSGKLQESMKRIEKVKGYTTEKQENTQAGL